MSVSMSNYSGFTEIMIRELPNKLEERAIIYERRRKEKEEKYLNKPYDFDSIVVVIDAIFTMFLRRF